MEVKLNVVVDELAGQCKDTLVPYRTLTCMYPSACVVLEINNTTIISNNRHHLIKAFTKPICI